MRILFGDIIIIYFFLFLFFLALRSSPVMVELFVNVYIVLNFCQFKGLLLW